MPPLYIHIHIQTEVNSWSAVKTGAPSYIGMR